MKLSKNIIAPIVSDNHTNIHVLGLCLKNGEIFKIKIYNKIFDDKNDEFILNFGGEDCLYKYKTINEWKNFYPGFSGFTIGVECSFENNNIAEIKYGYGFKNRFEEQLIFEAYYIDTFKKCSEKEIYDYIDISQTKNFDNKLKTEFLEVKRGDSNCYCYCPKINFKNINALEKSIYNALHLENKYIYDKIKTNSDQYFIVNYGLNNLYEKIYIVAKNKNDIQEIFNLLSILKMPLDKGLLI